MRDTPHLPEKPFYSARQLKEFGNLHLSTVYYRQEVLIQLGLIESREWPKVPLDAQMIIRFHEIPGVAETRHKHARKRKKC